MYKTVLMIVLLLSIASNSFAKVKSIQNGDDLLRNGQEYEKSARGEKVFDAMKAGMFMGYVFGVIDSNKTTLCYDKRKSVKVILANVTQYLNDHPGELSSGSMADELVLNALQKAFPCKQKSGAKGDLPR